MQASPHDATLRLRYEKEYLRTHGKVFHWTVTKHTYGIDSYELQYEQYSDYPPLVRGKQEHPVTDGLTGNLNEILDLVSGYNILPHRLRYTLPYKHCWNSEEKEDDETHYGPEAHERMLGAIFGTSDPQIVGFYYHKCCITYAGLEAPIHPEDVRLFQALLEGSIQNS